MAGNYELFLKVDVAGYPNEWVAICDGRIVAHGNNIKEVVRQASSLCQGKKPLVFKVPGKETLIY